MYEINMKTKQSIYRKISERDRRNFNFILFFNTIVVSLQKYTHLSQYNLSSTSQEKRNNCQKYSENLSFCFKDCFLISGWKEISLLIFAYIQKGYKAKWMHFALRLLTSYSEHL